MTCILLDSFQRVPKYSLRYVLYLFSKKGRQSTGHCTGREEKSHAHPKPPHGGALLAPTFLQASAASGSSYSEKSSLHEAGHLPAAVNLNNHYSLYFEGQHHFSCQNAKKSHIEPTKGSRLKVGIITLGELFPFWCPNFWQKPSQT